METMSKKMEKQIITTTANGLVINDDNFTEYFKDIRKNPKPQKGETLASWRATADFVDGWIKRNVLEMLATNSAGAESAHTVLRKMVGAIEKDSVRVAKEMAQDLVDGMSPDDILNKPYRFIIELFYWTKEEYVPKDPHWSTIKMVDLTDASNRTEHLKDVLKELPETSII